MPDTYLQLATDGEWEHALALPLKAAAMVRAEQWFNDHATQNEAALEIVVDTARGPSMIGVRALGADVPRLRHATLALLHEPVIPSLHAAGALVARAIGRPLFAANSVDALLLGAFNAWKSRGEVCLWERASGPLVMTHAIERAVNSHLARSPAREPIVLEAMTRTPLTHWVGLCVSTVVDGQHLLREQLIEQSVLSLLSA